MLERLKFPPVLTGFAAPGLPAFRGVPRRVAQTAAIAIAAVFMTAPAGGASPLDRPAAAPAERGPALWVVQDADTTIFLFGTFHALDQQSNWFNQSVRAAFDASDQLVLETLVPEDPAELHATIARNTAATEPRAGEPVYVDRNASSFVGSAGQAMSAGREMGMSVDHGADAVLRRTANAAGKPVAGLESFEFQLRMFGTLPPPPRAQAQPREGAATVTALLSDMQAAWKRGDNDGFAVILGNVRSQSPQAYKTLFADRNASWADWIADRMTRPGTVFVAVGTGHLVGPDSVQRYLAARGIGSARIS